MFDNYRAVVCISAPPTEQQQQQKRRNFSMSYSLCYIGPTTDENSGDETIWHEQKREKAEKISQNRRFFTRLDLISNLYLKPYYHEISVCVPFQKVPYNYFQGSIKLAWFRMNRTYVFLLFFCFVEHLNFDPYEIR